MWKFLLFILFSYINDVEAITHVNYSYQQERKIYISYNKGIALKNESKIFIYEIKLVDCNNNIVFFRTELGNKVAYYFPMELAKGLYIVSMNTEVGELSKRIVL